ncbi:hypothetical protein [Geodermatophilus sp. URMC 64]
MATRSALGVKVHVTNPLPKRYTSLPDGDSLRLALMLIKYETRELLMAYGGLRLGKTCAMANSQQGGDRLTVNRQV